MFSDAFARNHQLLKTDPKHGLYLACGLIVRGNVEMSDIRRNIDRCVMHCCGTWLKSRCQRRRLPLLSCLPIFILTAFSR